MRADVQLGKYREGKEQRDAIHIAVAPVECGESLRPGQPVKFLKPGVIVGSTHDESIGIVDPFLKGTVFPSTKVWLCMNPYTITSLRHEWTHPAFETPQVESEKWLREFASDVGVNFDRLMATASYCNAQEKDDWNWDYITLNYDTPDIVYNRCEEFWKHYGIYTGEQVRDNERTFIGCSC